MSVGLQKLDFMVSLLDKVSRPAGKMMSTMDKVTTNMQKGMRKVGYGTAGLLGVGYAMDRLIAPSKEMNRTMGEVQSLGVMDETLAHLKQTAVDFTNEYGGSAVEFVSASYDIQSAIDGLNGQELSVFTKASATLAMATKADIATVTDYTGTMYGIFKDTADKMGKAAWVNQLAGQTATAVQMFKTTGDKLSASFMNVGGTATEMGVSMAEQYAIIGQLSATMTGERAGTAYKSLLQGMGKAQDQLGISLEDSQGKLLPMADIIDKINGKVAGMGAVAKANALSDIFGGKRAVDAVTLLLNKSEALRKNTALLAQQKGMDAAIKMAQAISDPFERASAQSDNLKMILGDRLMPAITGLLDLFGAAAQAMTVWADEYPNLTKYIGYAVIGVAGLVAGIATLSIAMGIGSFLSAGWVLAGKGLIATFIKLPLAMMPSIASIWGFTAALLANPMTWVVVGAVALGVALASIGIYWDDITAAVGRFFDKISTLAGIKDLLTGLIPDFILKLMGVDVGGKEAARLANMGPSINAPKPIAPLQSKPVNGGGQGGVINRISNATNSNSNRSTTLNINTNGQPINGHQLMDEIAFMGG